MRLRHGVSLVRGVGFPPDEQGLTDGDLPFFKVGDFNSPGNQVYLRDADNWISNSTATRLRAHPVPPDSVLLPKIGAALLLGARRITTRPSVFDNNVLAVVPSSIDPRYLRYWLSSVDLAPLANPGPVPSLDDDALRDLRVPIADVAEQRAIAAYLDAETARIDRLVHAYQELARAIRERRATLTWVGVSGGPVDAHRRRSSVPWLDAVPDRWQDVKLTLVARLGSGHTPSREHPEWWTNCTIPWVTTGEVWQIREDRIEYLTETREMISEDGLANSAAELCPPDTVVLSRTASAGFSAIMGRDMATSQDYVTWQCGPLLRPRYLLLCLRAMRRDLLERLAMGSTHQTIYIPDIQSIRVPLPPLEEQDEIVDWVWKQLHPIDATLDVLARQTNLLFERRRALITAAVTGQLEIPGAAA
jgi:type I restriction enzyme, S subunit